MEKVTIHNKNLKMHQLYKSHFPPDCAPAVELQKQNKTKTWLLKENKKPKQGPDKDQCKLSDSLKNSYTKL